MSNLLRETYSVSRTLIFFRRFNLSKWNRSRKWVSRNWLSKNWDPGKWLVTGWTLSVNLRVLSLKIYVESLASAVARWCFPALVFYCFGVQSLYVYLEGQQLTWHVTIQVHFCASYQAPHCLPLFQLSWPPLFARFQFSCVPKYSLSSVSRWCSLFSDQIDLFLMSA